MIVYLRVLLTIHKNKEVHWSKVSWNIIDYAKTDHNTVTLTELRKGKMLTKFKNFFALYLW